MLVVLAVGAHPDDVEFGCGATLLKLGARGHHVHLFVATNGSTRRRQEQDRAAHILGIREVIWGSYEDRKLAYPEAELGLIGDIEAAVARLQPHIVLLPYEQDTHQDHRAITQAGLSATRGSTTVLMYQTPSSRNFAPTIFVEVGGQIEGKLMALQAHESQVPGRVYRLDEQARVQSALHGVHSRLGTAEGFVPVRLCLSSLCPDMEV